ncbi:MAG: hypothetical protein NWE92_10905 [Candidatus Bathyarchaeota archaeon]|nr:hypothetical protein [Candidatus Bathyarchaeota archaeon]
MDRFKKLFLITLVLVMACPISQISWASAQTSTSSQISTHGTIVTNTGGSIIVPTVQVHTGTLAVHLINNQNVMYSSWSVARPYVKYALVQGGGNLSEDGSITPVFYNDVSLGSLENYFALAQSYNVNLILDLAIVNLQNVSDQAILNLLTKLSAIAGGHTLIFDIGWEYNFPNYMTPWGDDKGHSFYIPPDVYNTKMALVHTYIQQNHLDNLLLASHANMLISTEKAGEWHSNPNFDGIVEYLDGMRQADVVGFSHYNDNLNQSWSRAQAIYNMIGTSKPCIFFEYAPTSPWQTGLIVTPQFVNDSYAMLKTYTFIKGMIWYFGPYCTNETLVAISQNAKIFEGV